MHVWRRSTIRALCRPLLLLELRMERPRILLL